MSRLALGLALAGAAAAGCGATGLTFKPEAQASGAPISADVGVAADLLRVTLETGGYRVEDVALVLPSGQVVAPRSVEHPSFREAASPVGLGVGGGMSGGSGGWSGGGGFGITFGGGQVRGAGQVERQTRAVFSREEAGPPPWRLRVRVVSTPPVDIVLDPDRPPSP